MSVFVECKCHRKQSLRNKICSSCGEDLVKLKRSNKANYWVTYWLPGRKCKFEKVKSTSIEYARDVEAKRKVQKREDRIFDVKLDAKMTFKELSSWYLNLEAVKALDSYFIVSNNLRKFNLVFGDRIVSSIKPSELEDYRIRRRKDGKADSTIDQEIGSAKTVINMAFDEGDLVSGDTLKRFKKVKKYLTGKKRNSNARKRVLTPNEFHDIVNGAPSHLKPILWMGYDTGMRLHEVLTLEEGGIFLRDRIIKLKAKDTKDNEDRDVPICEELFEILDRLPRGIRKDYPVFTYEGKRIKKDIRTALVEACKKAGIVYGRFKDGGFIYHDLRRTFVTDMRRAGVPESVIMTITGHSRGQVFDRYNQVTMDDMKKAVEKLTEYRSNIYQSIYQTPELENENV